MRRVLKHTDGGGQSNTVKPRLEEIQEMATEKEIFETAVEIDDAEARKDYLTHACGDDVELRNRVTGLLAFFDDEPAFLSEEKLLASRAVEDELTGQSVGSYTLREPIGEGGFGTVFHAEQTKPICRKVAVRIVKLGMDTRQVVARFEAERQALARCRMPLSSDCPISASNPKLRLRFTVFWHQVIFVWIIYTSRFGIESWNTDIGASSLATITKTWQP